MAKTWKLRKILNRFLEFENHLTLLQLASAVIKCVHSDKLVFQEFSYQHGHQNSQVNLPNESDR